MDNRERNNMVLFWLVVAALVAIGGYEVIEWLVRF